MERRAMIFVFALCLVVCTAASASDWPQWGGPSRDFKADATGLAAQWPEGGPKKLWGRELGDGYSAISVEGGRLYTMYRKGEQDVVVSLDAVTGKTLWEYAYDAPFLKGQDMSNGPGPHSAPLISGDRVFTTGSSGKFVALDKNTGKLLWMHDLMSEYKGTLRVNGYACSPLAYNDTVIVQVGGAGSAVMAFRQSDGSVAWKSNDFANSPSSPMLISVDGQQQLVAFFWETVAGIDPATGALLWSYPHKTEYGLNVSMPVWGPDNLLFVSSAYDNGSRVLRLTRADGKTRAEEVWASRLMRIHFGNAIRLGDVVYASSGDFGPAPLTAVDVKTGQILWRNRTLARASLLYAEGHIIALDEDGNLALATASREGLQVQSKFQLFSGRAWTAPTIAGSTLYARDRKSIVALDLR